MKIVIAFFKIIPLEFVKRICSRIPKLFISAPPGIVYEISDYLGQFRIRLDTKYAIERKMLTGHYERDTSQVIEEFVNEGDIKNVDKVGVSLNSIAIPKELVI